MRILIISNSEWDKNNSFGNTFNNFFDGIENIEFANIYCREGNPNTALCHKFLKISDKDLVKSLIDKKHHPAKIVVPTENNNNGVPVTNDNKKLLSFIKQKRWSVFFIIREILWSVSDYKEQPFHEFIEDFAPDILLLPTYSFGYINKMALYIQKKYNLPMISYMSDDEYSFRRFRFSPLYWMLRLYQSKWSVKGLKQSKLVYVISETQRRECKKDLNIDCKVLTKCADFSDEKKLEFKEPNDVLKIVYAGNISQGRYEILSELAKAIEKINSDSKKFELNIYTLTPLTKKQKIALSTESVHIYPPVSYMEIREIQKNSDILLHVEGFSLKEKLAVHQSFSTKIVDYLETNRCIFAIGDDYCASIQYFIENECGAVATKKEYIETELLKLHNNRDLLKIYAQKGWESGKKYHHKPIVQNMVKQDLKELLKL